MWQGGKENARDHLRKLSAWDIRKVKIQMERQSVFDDTGLLKMSKQRNAMQNPEKPWQSIETPKMTFIKQIS